MAVARQAIMHTLKAEGESVNRAAASPTRVLVVADDWGLRETLRLLLIASGYEASAVQNGIEALQQIRRETPTLLLCDLDMPGMSGFELLPIVRTQFPQVAVVAMSGLYSDDTVPEGVTADAFYRKGWQKPSELLQLVADAIQGSTAGR